MTSTPDPIEIHTSADVSGSNAVDLLHAASDLPKERIKHAMQCGAVWITRGNQSKRLRRAKRTLAEGDKLHLYYDPKVLAEIPPTPDLIADVGGYSVWRKPYGLRSQGSKWGDHCTVMRYAETHLEPERTSFTVHRLDLAANGLILVAHSKTIAGALGRLFQGRQIEKRYRAVVSGCFAPQNEPMRIEIPVNEKSALSEVTLLETSKNGEHSLVEVRIETGRKHQIRQHLAATGHPILGDRLYGNGAHDGMDLQLSAALLAFHCPVQDKAVEYRLPDKWLPALT